MVPCIYNSIGRFYEGIAITNVGGIGFEFETPIGGYGFINKFGKSISKILYDYVENFSDSIALVSIGCKWHLKINDDDDSVYGGKWGYINNDGIEVIPLIFDYANSFDNGIARVSKNGLWGFINKNGIEVVPIKYEYVSKFKYGYANIRLNDSWGIIDENGKEKWNLKGYI